MKSRVRRFNDSGDKFFYKEGWIFDDGELKWVLKEKVPMDAQIQAEKDLVELHAILKRYEDGDNSALNRVQGMYLDTVDLPSNYAEMYAAVNRANDVFDSMPIEIKEKYNNNAATFWKNYGTDAFDNLMNAYRSEVYSRYGMNDDEPINTVKDMENDRVRVEKAFDADRKELVKDEQKSE